LPILSAAKAGTFLPSFMTIFIFVVVAITAPYFTC
jgi:hypothetical protein